MLNVRQAAIASATPGGVRAGYTGTPDGHDFYRGPVVRDCGICLWQERGVIGRQLVYAISEEYMSPSVTSGDKSDDSELRYPLGPGQRVAPGL